MWRETDIFGVLVSPLLVYAAAALLLYLPLRLLLVRLHADRLIWNPPLADAAIYICILALLVLLF